MSDIFLSYAIQDRDKAAELADVLQEQGLIIWRPRSKYVRNAEYGNAAEYAKVPLSKMEGAKAVVVLWSRAATKAFFVREALKRARYLPTFIVLLEKAVPPPKAKNVAYKVDLSDWDGSASYDELKRLIRYVRLVIEEADAITAAVPSSAAPPAKASRAAPRASLEELSLSKIQENARRAVQEATGARPGDKERFGGVFISYRRDEAAAYARGLYDRLAARFGKEKVFLDMENVGWGEDFIEAIMSAAESCVVMIVLVSRQWSRGAGGRAEADDYVRLEVATALGRKIRVIPILIQGAAMPASKELPEDLSPLLRRNALTLSDTRWERDVEDLIKTLEGLLKD